MVNIDAVAVVACEFDVVLALRERHRDQLPGLPATETVGEPPAVPSDGVIDGARFLHDGERVVLQDVFQPPVEAVVEDVRPVVAAEVGLAVPQAGQDEAVVVQVAVADAAQPQEHGDPHSAHRAELERLVAAVVSPGAAERAALHDRAVLELPAVGLPLRPQQELHLFVRVIVAPVLLPVLVPDPQPHERASIGGANVGIDR